ncbi:unnamed protein product [Phytophthora lilii]|uniref:Unnamed protein product n=1 Tax=Phytophthora lilii TaxID=2077276 RepID=A0A9W6XGE5_9STRA|nr:unnamed protein product [Phytophthora lilii]
MRFPAFVLAAIGLGVSDATPGLWEQCRSANGTDVACSEGLICVPDVEYYGLCYTKVVDESGQCGGLGWNVSCVNGTTCERQNEGWASCEPTDAALDPAVEWQQCDPEDSGNACADGLMCVDDNDYHGLCVKEEAELWGQCGGSGWVTDCEFGSSCQVKTATYSQCLPEDSQSEDSSSGDDETLTSAPAQQQAAFGLALFFDMSSLLKPLAQLQEVAKTAKEFQCAMKNMVFQTPCDSSAV